MSSLDDDDPNQAFVRNDALPEEPDPHLGFNVRTRRWQLRRTTGVGIGVATALSALALLSLGFDRQGAAPPSGVQSAKAAGALPANALRHAAGDVGQEDDQSNPTVARWAALHPGPGNVFYKDLLTGSLQSAPPVNFTLLQVWRAGGLAYVVAAEQTDQEVPTLTLDQVVTVGAPLLAGIVGDTGHETVLVALAHGVVAVSYDRGDGHLEKAEFRNDLVGALSVNFDRTGPRGGRDALIATFADGHTERQSV